MARFTAPDVAAPVAARSRQERPFSAALFLFPFLALLPVLAFLGSCAHLSTPSAQGALASIDVMDESGATSSLGVHLGKRVVLDVCASWTDACLLNARALDEVCRTACGEGVEVITLLLDDQGATALQSYRKVLGVTHRVALPGARTRAGQSALGDVSGIPRLVLFDREGRIVEDITGGIVSTAGILRRLHELGR